MRHLLRRNHDGHSSDTRRSERLSLRVRKYLRSSIDSSDFKNYIFGLLLLKRFNDVFERVSQLMADEYLGQAEAADAEVCEDQGTLPPTVRLAWLITRTEDISEALDKAFHDIEAGVKGTDPQHVLSATPLVG
ncbi:type I restriction-modification system subunit M N-terminal domain-containing protein [Cupriavidus taiwanensis]|uniref:type I restriction-modification system subunit M N-terminal domain-containing protein n=1 Tax=Cupriavidus taiwanensis TaxID=164546 RepID=UPI000E126BE5|nr:type I restriction-modification system subunit M N-terminal domain-containing protein [Cupriavidus taiwanensis]SOY43633.1 hypothetical protein CBM2585_A10061 [Cupriavidus taiwanensis]